MKKIAKQIFVLLIACLFMCFVLCSCSKPKPEDGEECLSATIDNLTIVAEFFSDYEYDNIFVRADDGTMTLLLKGEEKISDKTVVDAIKALYDDGFKTITKSKENNAIAFLRWTKFNDFGAGLAYSIDKTKEPSVTYQTELISLSEDGWYYYESDYNEWRINNR